MHIAIQTPLPLMTSSRNHSGLRSVSRLLTVRPLSPLPRCYRYLWLCSGCKLILTFISTGAAPKGHAVSGEINETRWRSHVTFFFSLLADIGHLHIRKHMQTHCAYLERDAVLRFNECCRKHKREKEPDLHTHTHTHVWKSWQDEDFTVSHTHLNTHTHARTLFNFCQSL